MKFACAVIKAIEILASFWLFSPAAHSLEVKLNLIGRPATQSSDYDASFVAGNAIDGNYKTAPAAGSCSHTADSGGGISWWRVDLGQPVKVERVVLVNRGEGLGYRMNNFVVGVSNSSTTPVRGSYTLCGQYPWPAADGAYLNLQCDPRVVSGRWVIVQQAANGDGRLTICEIEIYYDRKARNCEFRGSTADLNRWERLSNQRLMSVDAIVLSKRSAMMCVGKCQETVDCVSVNYRQLDYTCEMNFPPSGAIGSHMVIENGWDNWVQMYEFI